MICNNKQCISLLNSKVLVLNKFFMALHVVTVRRAFILLCKESAEVVSIDNDKFNFYDLNSWRNVSLSKLNGSGKIKNGNWIKTFSSAIEVPEIIRLSVYDKLPQNIVKFNKKNIFERDKNTCQYCGMEFPLSELSLEHILPKSRGGKNEWTNIVSACTSCNKLKGGRTPIEAGLKLIRKPVRPKYNFVLHLKDTPEKISSSWDHFIKNIG